MIKPKAHTAEWNKDIYEARQTLNCQTLILEFLHYKEEFYDDCEPATKKTVQEFRNYLEKKKEMLKERGQKFEEKTEIDKDRTDEVKYNRNK